MVLEYDARGTQGDRNEASHRTDEAENGIASLALVDEAQSAFQRIAAQAAATSTEDLKRQLAHLLGLTAQNLVRLAVIVSELEKRGEKLEHIKMGLLPILRQIARGHLLPEVVVMYAEQPGKIRMIGAMPLNEQREVINGTRPAPERKWTRPSSMDREFNRPSGPPVRAPNTGKTPLEECMFELKRLRDQYGHLPTLKSIFAEVNRVSENGYA